MQQLMQTLNEPSPKLSPAASHAGVSPAFLNPARRSSRGGESFYVEVPSTSFLRPSDRRTTSNQQQHLPLRERASSTSSATHRASTAPPPPIPPPLQSAQQPGVESEQEHQSHDVPSLLERFKHLLEEGRALGVATGTSEPTSEYRTLSKQVKLPSSEPYPQVIQHCLCFCKLFVLFTPCLVDCYCD